ncbi:hypothetical protein EV426DRAFT_578989 [Tirmania nivea]|nr:hypothetical protein EV426DRAFT_578989 [Tirmania nivea]
MEEGSKSWGMRTPRTARIMERRKVIVFLVKTYLDEHNIFNKKLADAMPQPVSGPAVVAHKIDPKKGNVVYDTFEEDFNQLIPANAITFRRGSIMSCLDLIFVRKGLQANIHTLSGSWLGSDHALITVTIQTHGMSSRVYTTPDWTKWNEYIDSNPEYVPAHHGDAYKHLCWLAERFCRTKEATPRSKKWWDEELATQLKKTRRAGRKGEGYEQAKTFIASLQRRRRYAGISS